MRLTIDETQKTVTGEARLKLYLGYLQSSGANQIHLSLSHTTEHAVAQIILEKI